ncbi:MAG: 2-C-methyl-D-erythritol 2,4-cyclodiphosphate synthase, partial [Clostridia bacterium]
IHDGARPFLSQKVIDDAICCCQKNGNACPCVSCVDSLRIVEENGNYPVDRQQYVCAQTPQIFKPKELITAYKMAFEKGQTFSDDASVFQQFVGKVFLSQGDPANKKITTQDDFYAFAPNGFFVGVGWDTHQLVEGRKLILGGVQIEHTKGLLGHSDADVLTHAIMDAILSASHNRDIGCLFPDNDAAFKDIDSMILLAKVVKLVAEQGFEINNVSATIIPTIADNLCKALSLRNNQLSIAATTTEKLGLVGHEEAISVYATCSLRQN